MANEPKQIVVWLKPTSIKELEKQAELLGLRRGTYIRTILLKELTNVK